MNRSTGSTVAGLLLVATGVLFLLLTMGIVNVVWSGVWAILFGATGLGFLGVFLSGRDRWWAAIPGFGLLGLGALLSLETLAPWAAQTWGGPLFLGSIGIGFLAVYLVRREFWWAIIPAGTLLTLSLVAAIDQNGGRRDGGPIFLLGLGLTFALVYLLTVPRERMRWALIPAAVLLVLGAATAMGTGSMANFIWPVVLISVGAYLVFRSWRSQEETQGEKH